MVVKLGAAYFMRMNSPSGGTKEMVRSLSNLPSLTHWWKVMSASSIPVPLQKRNQKGFRAIQWGMTFSHFLAAAAAGALSSIPSLSFMPKRHSRARFKTNIG